MEIDPSLSINDNEMSINNLLNDYDSMNRVDNNSVNSHNNANVTDSKTNISTVNNNANVNSISYNSDSDLEGNESVWESSVQNFEKNLFDRKSQLLQKFDNERLNNLVVTRFNLKTNYERRYSNLKRRIDNKINVINQTNLNNEVKLKRRKLHHEQQLHQQHQLQQQQQQQQLQLQQQQQQQQRQELYQQQQIELQQKLQQQDSHQSLHDSDSHSLIDETIKPQSISQSLTDFPGLSPDYCLPTTALERAKCVQDSQNAIWLHISRKEIPKVHRYIQAARVSHHSFHKRISLLAQREQKKSSSRTTKNIKEVQARAKRLLREVLVHWRRNEKDEREVKRKAEKEALDKAKAEEAARESKRQSRKLNFLITQTELYSHFVGSKIKTDEAEQSNDTAADPSLQPNQDRQKALDLSQLDNNSNLDDIDYDDDDESNLRAHAARNAQQAWLDTRDKANEFDKRATEEKRRNEAIQNAKNLGIEIPEHDDEEAPPNIDGDELNFQNPSLGDDSVQVTQPKLLAAQLKDYQLKGLNWLANLYEQGINGILADEMGLGKTVQSISLMAYLAEKHDIWGPFLIITPASTLHNWQQEITKFVPDLKALPYWGSTKDRAALRKFWQKKAITYTKDAPFHVLVTSYQLVLSDEKYFKNVKWQYMILDEAQAIKSSSSARWNTLLSFKCRNRLLLTGTPIQNSMQELWALLHFIMPTLFDNHDEFAQWFSKDIESNAENKSAINEHQLRRLHMILKPFMLRRVKKNVQNELGDKIEVDVYCDLSPRQRALYRLLRSKISISDLIEKASKFGDESSKRSLVNLVMQFRKVCNHPELFERADVKSPLVFANWSRSKSTREPDVHYCPDNAKSLIEFNLPKLIANDDIIGGVTGVPSGKSNFGSNHLESLMNIWSPNYIVNSLKKPDSAFAFLPQSGFTVNEISTIFKSNEFNRSLIDYAKQVEFTEHKGYDDDKDLIASKTRPMFNLNKVIPSKVDIKEYKDQYIPSLNEITALKINESPLLRSWSKWMSGIKRVVAPSIYPYVQDQSNLERLRYRVKEDEVINKTLFGLQLDEFKEDPSICEEFLPKYIPPNGLVENSHRRQLPSSNMTVPEPNKLILDSSKLVALDELLTKLKAEGHRVLIYFQMTKMIDLIQEYLVYKGYKYLRLDGSSKINDRRDMVQDWQTSDEYFVFLLSTRAGGLGINLTAADTVIFFEHDWNPSNDQQAMDRAHRLGQTRQVTVYRLIIRNTIDERIVQLARVKKDIQDMVVGQKSADTNQQPNEREIIQMLMEEEQNPIEADYPLPINGNGGDSDSLLNQDNVGIDDDGLFNVQQSNSNQGQNQSQSQSHSQSHSISKSQSMSQLQSQTETPNQNQNRNQSQDQFIETNNTGISSKNQTPTQSRLSTPKSSRPPGRPPGSSSLNNSSKKEKEENKDSIQLLSTPTLTTPDGQPRKRIRRTKKQMEEDAAAQAAHEAYLIKEGIAPEKKKRGRKPKLKQEQEAQAQKQWEELQAQQMHLQQMQQGDNINTNENENENDNQNENDNENDHENDIDRDDD